MMMMSSTFIEEAPVARGEFVITLFELRKGAGHYFKDFAKSFSHINEIDKAPQITTPINTLCHFHDNLAYNLLALSNTSLCAKPLAIVSMEAVSEIFIIRVSCASENLKDGSKLLSDFYEFIFRLFANTITCKLMMFRRADMAHIELEDVRRINKMNLGDFDMAFYHVYALKCKGTNTHWGGMKIHLQSPRLFGSIELD